ncbi:MAG: type IV toxin-antitoxin system AbiEi family antitoxin domain-containing protein [Microlunatus sp.]|nr:type IV toxin-antitoxin system AbiEi family antitoxin domain-containing protein [Microlunatus sp.]
MDRIVLTEELRSRGYDTAAINQLRRTGQLRVVRRGAYLLGSEADVTPDPSSAHRLLIDAAVRQHCDEAVVSHMSAAVLHDLPTWNDQLTKVQLIRNRAGGGRNRSNVIVRGLLLGSADIVQIDGISTTSLPRTVLDLACQLPLSRSVAVGDAALRAAALSYPYEDLRPTLESLLMVAGGRTGVPRARQAIAMLDGRSESVGESRSRVVLIQAGVPTPQLQYEVYDAVGRFLARTDFAWPEARTLGEFDGRIKYSGQLGEAGEDILFAEKRREDRLRSEGWEMVRWVWSDLKQPAALIRNLERAFARGRRG